MWGPLLAIAAGVVGFAVGVYFGLVHGRKTTARRALDHVADLGRAALHYGEDVGMPGYTPTLRWFLNTYLPAHWPAQLNTSDLYDVDYGDTGEAL